MSADHRFVEGLKLFNEGDYFECHEVIENLWLETPGEDRYRDLYKGVIQAAAAIYQWDRGILSGALGLYKTSVGYLQIYQPAALGLDIEKMLREMKTCFKTLEPWDGKTHIQRDNGLTPVLKY